MSRGTATLVEGIVYGVLMTVIAMATFTVLAQSPGESAPVIDEGCCFREGALKIGMERAMTLSARGQHDKAQQVAREALVAAGYRCSWVPIHPTDQALTQLRCARP